MRNESQIYYYKKNLLNTKEPSKREKEGWRVRRQTENNEQFNSSSIFLYLFQMHMN
jgi:hypothetical protein